MNILIILSALLLDAVFKEPAKFHPLVGFGLLAKKVESRLYGDSKLKGVFALSMLLLPFFVLGLYLQQLSFAPLITAVLLYSAIGRSSLTLHAEQVLDALLNNDITRARDRVSCIVSRDTSELDEQGIVNATIETVLENGSDAIFAAIFWALVAGPVGVLVYRLANTLDAMWGYRNDHYLNFGWAAARLDDVLNVIPARLTALTYAMAGHFVAAIRCWLEQGTNWKSPNAGPVMAAGAGSLGIELGGPAVYHGKIQQRPALGTGRTAKALDIRRSLKLIDRTLVIWVAFLALSFLCNILLN